MRVWKGPMFIFAMLEAIDLCKDILTLELEMGREVLIPQLLNIKDLPFSFQYYDCILQTISKDLSGE